ncbi:LytS/YhcK type 5TM receptor domain-containing protein [Alkalibacterium sp. f15]|uniref:LytS/YhcK type 5TM receptor domain-containing protein n=1 Tax=Alkalibacterium sp. f15 TaxID=3414029 RepID=UPI003BF82642
MATLFILMLERVGLIIVLAYLLLNIPYFKRVLMKRERWSSKVQLIAIFSLFAFISNYTGVEIGEDQQIINQLFTTLDADSSLANTRVLTIGISGLIGGSPVGIAVGLISGIIRYLQGGSGPHIYLISSTLIGIFSGLFGDRFIGKGMFPRPVDGIFIGTLTELVQMVSILILSTNTQEAYQLVQLIALPMIMTNSIGMALFLSIIRSFDKLEQETRAVQTHAVLELAEATLPYFRSGLNEDSSSKAARIIHETMKVSAVSITDKDTIMAHVGAASDHHKPPHSIVTDLSKEVIATGMLKEARSREEIGCHVEGCPLEAALVIPLKVRNEVRGTLKFYFTDKNKLTYVERQLAEGLGKIFSSQLEFGELEMQKRLMQDAEIKSLQAQVNPHFFFNALNTISALIRIDSEKARDLLYQLSAFFRSNLQGVRQNLITTGKELQQVDAYLSLEQARFPDRYRVTKNIDEDLLDYAIPPFMIQILVENAIKHAFVGKKEDNEVVISITEEADYLCVEVKDNGIGVDPDILKDLGKREIQSSEGTGSAIENLNRRLISLFGEVAELNFQTSDEGTSVVSHIPKRRD